MVIYSKSLSTNSLKLELLQITIQIHFKPKSSPITSMNFSLHIFQLVLKPIIITKNCNPFLNNHLQV